MKKSMKPYYTLIALLVIGFSFTSCDKDPQVAPNPQQINFQAPAVGQENYYLRYSGLCGELIPTGDTLILKITGFDGDDLFLEEIFTKGSPSYYQQGYAYQAKWNADMIEIHADFRQNSQLFFFYGSDFLKLTQPSSKSMSQNNCIVWDGQSDFRGDDIGNVEAFQVGDQGYYHKKIVSCVPTILDLDAYLLYDQNTIYSSFTSSTGGWEPLEDPYVNAYALIDSGQ
jgi:hypothetical protein